MKKLLFIYSILFLSFSSCMVEGVYDTSLLLENINRIELVSKDSLLISDPSTKSISFEINYYNSEGLVSLNNNFQPKLLLDGVTVDSLMIDLSKEREFLVEAELPNKKKIRSNEILIRVLKLENAVKGVKLSFKKSLNRIIKFEDEGSFQDYFSAELELLTGQKIIVSDFSQFLKLFSNEIELSKFEIASLNDGNNQFKLKIGNVESNTVEVEIINPNSFIKSIELSFSDSTNNPYALAGVSRYDFNYKVIGMDDKELPIKSELMLQNIKQSGFENILINSSGQLKTEAVAYGKKSNTLIINSRSDIPYPKVRIPLIFHILPNYSQIETISEQQLKNTINQLNKAYSNTYLTSQSNKKSSSAVNVGVEFYLAENSINGTALTEKGIHRLSDNRTAISWPPNNSENNFLFNQMWDPTQYLNVFVSKIEGPAGGFAYYPLVENFSLPGVGRVPSGATLNYPYVSVIGYGMTNPTDVYVLAHEIGHMLGLYHSHRENGNSCSSDVDYCADTDGVILDKKIDGYFYENCQNQRITDYDFMSYGGFKNSFTFDQRERVRRVLENNPFLPVQGLGARIKSFKKGVLDFSIKPVQ